MKINVDSVSRIVIPKKMMKELGIGNEVNVEMVDNKIILTNPTLNNELEFLRKRENKLQTIEMMFASGTVDLDELSKIVKEEN